MPDVFKISRSCRGGRRPGAGRKPNAIKQFVRNNQIRVAVILIPAFVRAAVNQMGFERVLNGKRGRPSRPQIEVTCQHCEKSFWTKRCEAKYCSKKCSAVANAAATYRKRAEAGRPLIHGVSRPLRQLSCLQCGKTFETKDGGEYRTRKYCSKKCSAASAHAKARQEGRPFAGALCRGRNYGGIVHTVRKCKICERDFHPRTRHQLCCGKKCASTASLQAAILRRADPELKRSKRSFMNARRAAARRSGGHRPNPRQLLRICERDGWICHLCGLKIDWFATNRRDRPTRDHIVPFSEGGNCDDSNLRAAHYGCNSRRSNKPLSKVIAA